MTYNKENTLIIVISIATPSEKKVLEKCGRIDCNDNNWSFAYTDGTIWKCKRNKESIDNGDYFSFLLINQCKCNETDFCDRIKYIIKNNDRTNIVVWSHQTDRSGNNSCPPMSENDKSKILNLSEKSLLLFYPFSHSPSGDSLFEKALRDIPEKYVSVFNCIIQESLKKKANPHLIALSILCQGYLAAHGDDDSIKELSEELKKEVQDLIKLKNKVQSKAGNTEKKIWWTGVFGDDDKKGAEGKILNELKTISTDNDKEKGKIESLIKKIYKNGNTLPNGTLVANAYSALKSILKG